MLLTSLKQTRTLMCFCSYYIVCVDVSSHLQIGVKPTAVTESIIWSSGDHPEVSLWPLLPHNHALRLRHEMLHAVQRVDSLSNPSTEGKMMLNLILALEVTHFAKLEWWGSKCSSIIDKTWQVDLTCDAEPQWSWWLCVVLWFYWRLTRERKGLKQTCATSGLLELCLCVCVNVGDGGNIEQSACWQRGISCMQSEWLLEKSSIHSDTYCSWGHLEATEPAFPTPRSFML